MAHFKFAEPMNVQSLEDCFFYHTMDLPGLGSVTGHWDLRGRFDDYIGGVDVRGKSVLDIGTASGFLTFEAEKRGASSLVSFDISDAQYQHCLPFKDGLYYRDHASWRTAQTAWLNRWKNAYWLAHRLLNSKAKAFYGDIYHLPPEAGEFDIAIVGCVLEHLSEQVSALASVARLTKSKLVLITPILETDEKTAYFSPSASRPDIDFAWWVYSLGTYREVLSMLGFKIAAVTKHKYRCVLDGVDHQRHTLVAERAF